ncbi:MAG: hypothetical protein IKJ69_04165 [Clostridia bacterium]|nr:hypothetical protein [Clostridia bacterium]
MKRSLKILLASLLAVIMVISASPLNGFADSGIGCGRFNTAGYRVKLY